MLDGGLEDARGVLRAVFLVDFEGFRVGVGHVVGFFELVALDRGCFFKGLAGFAVCGFEKSVLVDRLGEVGGRAGLTLFLHSEGVGGLGV